MQVNWFCNGVARAITKLVIHEARVVWVNEVPNVVRPNICMELYDESTKRRPICASQSLPVVNNY